MNEKNIMDIEEIRGRKYYYSREEDTWYPMPDKLDNDLNAFAMFMAKIGAVCVVCWLAMEYFGLTRS